MPCPIVYQTFEAPVVEVPRPCLAPVVQLERMPGAPGASPAARVGDGESASAVSASGRMTAAARGRTRLRLRPGIRRYLLSRAPTPAGPPPGGTSLRPGGRRRGERRGLVEHQ